MSLFIKLFRKFAFVGATVLVAGTAVAEQPPEILSASSPTAASEVKPNAIAVDGAGNTYITGSFYNGATFGTNALISSGGAGFDDVYLVKYDPAGAVLWARRAGGSGKDFGNALMLDGQGGVYVAGTSDSSPAAFGTNILYMAFKTLFLAHYDGNGTCLWVRRGGSWQPPGGALVGAVVTVNALAVDPAGNPVVAGSFNGNPRIGGVVTNQSFLFQIDGGIVLSNRNVTLPTSFEDMFVAKFSGAGELLWATNYGGTNTEFANSMAVDSSGGIYTVGGYKVSTTVGAQTYTNVGNAILFTKLSPEGDVVWSSNLSDATNSNIGFGWSVAVDSADRVTVSLEVTANTPFQFRGFAVTNKTGGNFGMGILAQFDTAGNLLWLQRTPFNAVNTSPANLSTLTVDSLNNIYLGSIGRELAGSGFAPAAIAVLKYNSAGVPLWTNSFQPNSSTFTTPIARVDAAGITHVIDTMGGDQTYRVTVGWTNYFPFNAIGHNQLVYTIASNFVPVIPQFVMQPTNMIFQPPQGITNSAIARGWPAPRYFWCMEGVRIANATNSVLNIAPTGFTNRANYFVVASNAYGMTTSLVVHADVRLGFVTMAPTNVTVLINTPLSLSATATGTTAIAYQWRLNGTNIAGATSPSLGVAGISTNQAGSYTLVISNATGMLTSTPPTTVTVVLPGFVDPNFTNVFTGTLDLLRDSQGGYYVAKGTYVYHLNTNSALDVTGPWAWDAGNGPGTWSLTRESETQFLRSGMVTGGIVRVGTNGVIDTTFNAGSGSANTTEGASFNRITSVLRLTNGQYLVAGRFNVFNGVAETNLVRLNTNGSLDLTFPKHSIQYSTNNPVQGNGEILRIAQQVDGKILVGGQFSLFDGASVSNLVRLNFDGTVDGSFSADPVFKQAATGRIHAILPLADGRILVGGAWQNPTNAGIVRINTNGSLDATFNGPASTAPTHAILLVQNKIVVGGQNFITRMSFDGALDPTFTTGSAFNSGQTEVMVLEPSGNLVVGGSYGVRRLWLEPIVNTLPGFSAGNSGIVNGLFQSSACGGVDGQTIVVQASQDFVNWTNISTNVVSGGCITFTDGESATLPNRYYRLIFP